VIELRRSGGRLLQIGHRGAGALAPENTIDSLRLAVELGCDLVEFDVVDLPGGTLALGHSLKELAQEPASLDEALAFLAGTEAGVHLDLKARGVEAEVADALRRHDLVGRTVVSSFRPASLRALGALEPRVRLGLTYPEDRSGLGQRRVFAPFAGGALACLRAALPRRIGKLLARAGATTAMLHWQVISRTIVERCHALGAPVLVWTVDDPDRLRRFDELGVDGVITNDPRLFAAKLPP
jgi:glycerophosphoryl diester phosphodiesterase